MKYYIFKSDEAKKDIAEKLIDVHFMGKISLDDSKDLYDKATTTGLPENVLKVILGWITIHENDKKIDTKKMTKADLMECVEWLEDKVNDLEDKYEMEKRYRIMVEHELAMLKKEIYDGRANN